MASTVHPAAPLNAVYFDCDSTLTAIEGVDELLQFADPALRADVARMTEQAMNGERPLAEVYEARLARLAPRREQLGAVGELYVQHLVPGARATVAALQHLGKQVGIVSGGLLLPVQHVAAALGIATELVHAVPVLFDADGHYRDFDRASPLWRNGGKVTVLQQLPGGHHPLAFVGDGVTDLETAPHVARFVGFGGVIDRPAVRAGSRCFVAAPDLSAVLPWLLTHDEWNRLTADPRFADLAGTARS